MSAVLYLVRHGIAVSIGEQGVRRDEDRMLSPEGTEKTKRVADTLRLLIQDEVGRIVSSPFCRARQTADIIAKTLGGHPEVELISELAAGEDIQKQLRWLRRQPGENTILVGHMPDLALLASYLISGTDRVALQFGKAGAARIAFPNDFSSGMGCLEWLLPPMVLRRINK